MSGASGKKQKFLYSSDGLKSANVGGDWLVLRGWLIPDVGLSVQNLRVRVANKIYKIDYGQERADVALAFPDINQSQSLHSGFICEFELQNGEVGIVEVDLGEGYGEVEQLTFNHTVEETQDRNYNPNLAKNWVEHSDLLKSKSSYFYEGESDKTITLANNDPKVMAFYLPQYHPISENDITWGKGFTEWRNVTQAEPRFVGHYQPMLPSDLGFYDLRLTEIMQQQIELAKSHGIYGFCFYYYWFSGQHILDKPLNNFLMSKWDFNFTICWANENWTKRWDGSDNEVIISQKYRDEDPLDFIKDVEHILLDKRYVRIDNRPVLAVYRVKDLKDPRKYTKIWRDYFRRKHKLELHLVSVLSFNSENPEQYGFDAGIEFMPQNVFFKTDVFEDGEPPRVAIQEKLIDPSYEGTVLDFRKIVLNKDFHKSYEFPTYSCVMPSWDNDARKKGKGGYSFHYSNPDLYAHWLDVALTDLSIHKKDLLFVNAWNEWAEGTTLEPSLHYGHALLNRTAEVLAKHSSSSKNQKGLPLYGFSRTPTTDLAVIVHLYYPEMWESIQKRLAFIQSEPWDLFVTLPEKEKDFAKKLKEDFPGSRVIIVPNKGRDILPFVHVARRLEEVGYKKLLKLHTKKSLHRKDGKKWFEDIISNLLPNKAMVDKTLELLQEKPALIGPDGHYLSLDSFVGGNESRMKELLKHLDSFQINNFEIDQYAYFGGSMFWAHTDSIKPILNMYLMPEDFELESGQIDNTTAHAIERLFGVVAQHYTYPVYTTNQKKLQEVTTKNAQRRYKYAE